MYGCYQETKKALTAVHVKDAAAAIVTVGVTFLTERPVKAEKYKERLNRRDNYTK